MTVSLSDRAGPPLAIRLFGSFQVWLDGKPLRPLRSRKGQWLIALLALRAGQEVERVWLAGTLWPGSSEAQALANLRNSLTDLRGVLGPEAARLRSPTPHTLCLDLAGAGVDVVDFDAAIGRAESPMLEQAVMLYRGPLLEGCTEEWAFQQRQAREQAYLTALETLAAEALSREDLAVSAHYLRRVVAVDPLRETAQRALMQALAAAGNHAAATEVYRDLRLRLHRELNVEPDTETQSLHQLLRAKARGQAGRSPKGSSRLSLVTPDLPARFTPSEPPLRAAASHNLPLQLTCFIGREDQMAEVEKLLSEHRLVTLTGVGGCGKTRLALQMDAELLERFPNGVWFVDLAPLANPELVPQTVATALGLQEAPGRPPAQRLRDYLKPRQLVLLLDNCEHLIEACAPLVHALLESCPQLRVLATSREALGVAGERTYRVPPLSVPDARRLPTLDQLTRYESVRLFMERAVAVLPSFQVTAENASAVTQICCQLEGSPLAIELAAARVRAVSVEQIAARLSDLFRLLTGGSRTASPRQQTLRALIDWSYNLLSEVEQTALRRLSVFAGGWTLEAAEAVCSDFGFWILNFGLPAKTDGLDTAVPLPLSDPIQNPKSKIQNTEVLDLLTRLSDKSLVLVEEGAAGAVRYRLLETVRQYGRDRLLEAGEADGVRARHHAFFLWLAEEAEPALRGPEQGAWLDWLQAENDNLRAALDGCRSEPSGAEADLRLASALVWYWIKRGRFGEGRQRLEAALSQGSSEPSRLRARALQGAGVLAHFSDDQEASISFFERSVEMARAVGDRWTLTMALFGLALRAAEQHHDERARTLGEESLALAREAGDPWLLAHALVFSKAEYERALTVETLALMRQAGDKWSIAMRLLVLAMGATSEGDHSQARTLCQEGLAISQELKDKRGIARFMGVLAAVAGAQGHAQQAARLLGATEALLEAIGVPFSGGNRSHVSAIQEALGEEAFVVAREAGRAIPLEQAIQYAQKEAVGD